MTVVLRASTTSPLGSWPLLISPTTSKSPSLSLNDSIITRIASISTLTQIICVNNKIESLDNLKQLSSLKKLEEVDFGENPVSEKSNYRAALFDSYLFRNSVLRVSKSSIERTSMVVMSNSNNNNNMTMRNNMMRMMRNSTVMKRMMIMKRKRKARSLKRREND